MYDQYINNCTIMFEEYINNFAQMYDKITDPTFLYNYLYTNCTIGIRHPADGRNMLLQNNNV